VAQGLSKLICCHKHIPKAALSSAIPIHPIQQRAAFHHYPALAMKVAQVTSWGSPPEYMSGPDLPPPSSTQLQLKVVAVGVPRVVQIRAACKHPSAFDAALPFDPSIDGVGLDEATGDLYFINPLAAPLFAERANVDSSQLMKLEPGADPVTVAALANPVSSSWMALRCRAVGGCQGRTVVIVGATSASGRAAAIVARSLGAARVVGLSRSEDTLAAVEGLDDRVLLRDPFVLPQSVGPVHIVLDYVGGPAAVGLLQTAEAEPGENLQYIQVGGLAGQETHMLQLLPPHLINLKPICIMGSGMGSFSKQDLKKEMPGLVSTITKMKRPFEIFTAPLTDVQSVWESENAAKKRLVLVPSL
jgi:NADPH:quinone reductase-like Zn-dependent oxidoreductase